MFNKNGEMHHQFPVKGDGKWSVFSAMIVDSKLKVVLTGTRTYEEDYLLYVYENNGQFVCSFGEGLLADVTDLALATDDRVIVLDEDRYVHISVNTVTIFLNSNSRLVVCLHVVLHFTIQVNMSSSLMLKMITFTSIYTPKMVNLRAATKSM